MGSVRLLRGAARFECSGFTSVRSFVRFLLWTAIIVGVLVGLARLTAIRWYRIPHDDLTLSASIGPNLKGGDLVILWRLTPPNRGDLVLCPEPGAEHEVVIGRILAEAGDQVVVAGNTVTVNGTKSDTEEGCPDFEVEDPNTTEVLKQACSVETLGGHRHWRGDVGKREPARVDEVVADDAAWLVSDNRGYPFDSRDYGAVLRETCTETVIFRLVGAGGYFDERRFTYIR